MIIQSIDCGLLCIRCKNYCHMISRIQTFKYCHSDGACMVQVRVYCWKCPRVLHIFNRVWRINVEHPNVLSSLLEITVVPLAFTGYRCARCAKKPLFECKKQNKNELCHIILMRITSWASPPPSRAWCNPTGSRTVSSCTNQNMLKHSNHRDF